MRLKKYIWELARLNKKVLFIKPTMRCNLKCPYCAVNIAHGRPPQYDEIDPEKWVDMINKSDYGVLTISGGEPGIYKGIARIINAAIDKKMVVRVFTNLTVIDEFMRIRKSWRVVFLASYHHIFSHRLFTKNYSILRDRFHVDVRELGVKTLSYSKLIKINNKQTDNFQLIYAPDGSLHNSCKSIDEKGQ